MGTINVLSNASKWWATNERTSQDHPCTYLRGHPYSRIASIGQGMVTITMKKWNDGMLWNTKQRSQKKWKCNKSELATSSNHNDKGKIAIIELQRCIMQNYKRRHKCGDQKMLTTLEVVIFELSNPRAPKIGMEPAHIDIFGWATLLRYAPAYNHKGSI